VSTIATTSKGVAVVRRRRPRGAWRRRNLVVILFLSPWIIGFFAFIVYPAVATLYFSFTRYDLLTAPEWTGLGNYRFMIHDPQFWQGVRNTLWLVVFLVPLQVVFSITVASVLTRPKRGVGVYRTIYFLPSMVPVVAAALGFRFLLNPVGPINTVLGFLHLPQPFWFEDPRFAKPGLLLLGLWGIGEMMIIFLAALLDVPKQLYEAADLEGATAWQRYRHVTLPTISPVIFFALVIGVIDGFQYFAQAYVASGGRENLGAPQGSLRFYSIWLYEQGFTYLHLGYAAALAWVLFIIVMIVTFVLVKTQHRWVHYQGGFR
jgi:multiple sugar transport system permease protein